MTKGRLVKVIFDKCKNGKGLTKRQGEIVDCFLGLANLSLEEPFNARNNGSAFEEVLLKEIKEFIFNQDYSRLKEIFKGV